MTTKYNKLNLITKNHNLSFENTHTKLAVLFKMPTICIVQEWLDTLGEFTHEEIINNLLPHIRSINNISFDIDDDYLNDTVNSKETLDKLTEAMVKFIRENILDILHVIQTNGTEKPREESDMKNKPTQTRLITSTIARNEDEMLERINQSINNFVIAHKEEFWKALAKTLEPLQKEAFDKINPYDDLKFEEYSTTNIRFGNYLCDEKTEVNKLRGLFDDHKRYSIENIVKNLLPHLELGSGISISWPEGLEESVQEKINKFIMDNYRLLSSLLNRRDKNDKKIYFEPYDLIKEFVREKNTKIKTAVGPKITFNNSPMIEPQIIDLFKSDAYLFYCKTPLDSYGIDLLNRYLGPQIFNELVGLLKRGDNDDLLIRNRIIRIFNNDLEQCVENNRLYEQAKQNISLKVLLDTVKLHFEFDSRIEEISLESDMVKRIEKLTKLASGENATGNNIAKITKCLYKIFEIYLPKYLTSIIVKYERYNLNILYCCKCHLETMDEYKTEHVIHTFKTLGRKSFATDINTMRKLKYLVAHEFCSDSELLESSNSIFINNHSLREYIYVPFNGNLVYFDSTEQRDVFVAREIQVMSTVNASVDRCRVFKTIEDNILEYGNSCITELFRLIDNMAFFIYNRSAYVIEYKPFELKEKYANEELLLFLSGLEPAKLFVSGSFSYIDKVGYDSIVCLLGDNLEFFKQTKDTLRKFLSRRTTVEVNVQSHSSAREVKIQRALDILEVICAEH